MRTSLIWHLGLGDALICHGIVRYWLATLFSSVRVPAYRHNYESVKWMFRDDPRILVEAVDSEADMLKWSGFPIGHYGAGFDVEHWDTDFYRQAEVPFGERWELFRVDETGRLPVFPVSRAVPPFMLVHNSNGKIDTRTLPDILAIDVDDCKTNNLFDWVFMIRLADSIHCTDSCLAILADMVPTKPGARLVLHQYAKPTKPPVYKKNWEILT